MMKNQSKPVLSMQNFRKTLMVMKLQRGGGEGYIPQLFYLLMLVNELDPGTHPFRKGAIFMRYLGRFLEQGPDVFWFWKEEQLPFSASEKEGNYFVCISKKGTTAFSLFQGGGEGGQGLFMDWEPPIIQIFFEFLGVSFFEIVGV